MDRVIKFNPYISTIVYGASSTEDNFMNNIKKCASCGDTNTLIFLKKLKIYYCSIDWNRKKKCSKCAWIHDPDTYYDSCAGCGFTGNQLKVPHNMNRTPKNTILKARSKRWNTPSRTST